MCFAYLEETVMSMHDVLLRMRCKLGCYLILLGVFLLAMPGMLFSQAYFGTVSGTLTDPTGAVIPGVKVTLVDQEKGYQFKAASDNAGRYLYRSIPPGIYTVNAELEGFQKTIRTGIRVDINENATANLTLKVASSVQTVEVTSQNTALNAQDATTGLVVDRKFINDLPLINRYAMDLTMLTPGVTETDDQCGVSCGGTNFVSNGSRNATADVLMDGVTVTNYEPNGGVTEMMYTPSSEAVEEFKVEQSNFSAEYGFSGASVVNMVTRSGTNSFHGEVYDFARNKITDANGWFNNYNGVPLAAVHRQNFGGTIGGPIIKNKTFFFFDFDGTRQSSSSSYTAGVPSDAERNDGDFGEVCTYYGGSFDSTGMCSATQGQLWDPYTSTYTNVDGYGSGAVRSGFIPYNKVGAYASPGNSKLNGTAYELAGGAGNLIDPIAQKMMKLFPEPSTTMGNSNIYENWAASGASHYPSNQFDIKIDHRFSEKNLLSGKYSHEWNTGNTYNAFGNYADPNAGGTNTSTVNLFTLNDTHTITPTLLLTATLGFTRHALKELAYNGAGGVTDPLSTLGFPSYLNSTGFMGFPSMYINGGYYSANSSAASMGSDPYGNYKEGEDSGQLSISVNKVWGAHEAKFGFEGRQHQMNYIQSEAPNGVFNFDTTGSSQCWYDLSICGGDAMASFMMGRSSSNSYEIQDEPATEDRQYAWFAQDNWKVNHKLTLNLGLRYDISMPRTERHNRQNWLDLTVKSPFQVSGMPTLYGGEVFASSSQRRIVDIDLKDIQPRFGFAYQLDQRTVVRGGYGIYYSQPRSGATGVQPYVSGGFKQSTNAIMTYGNDRATPYIHLSNPFPTGLLQPKGSTLGLMSDIGYSMAGSLRNVTNTPYEQSWSFGFQRQLPAKFLVNVMYVGKKGTHLYFSGSNWINHLPVGVEGYSEADKEALTSMVDNPFYGTITDSGSDLYWDQVPEYYLQLPYPQFPWGVSVDPLPIANSTYHALQVTADKRYSNGLQLFASFVWSKSIDDASAPDDNTTWLGSFTSYQDPNKLWLERSLSSFDIPAVLQLSYTYDLPLGQGKYFFSNMPKILDAMVGGWKTNGVWRLADGRPLAMGMADGVALPGYGQRPNITGVPRRTKGKASTWINNYFANPEVFSKPASYALGNAPRTTGMIRSPKAFSCNMSIEKDFSLAMLHEGTKFELRLEAENAFNHPIFGTPNTSVDGSDFGKITYTSNGARQIQLGGKVTF
jgi:hypothetical protein